MNPPGGVDKTRGEPYDVSRQYLLHAISLLGRKMRSDLPIFSSIFTRKTQTRHQFGQKISYEFTLVLSDVAQPRILSLSFHDPPRLWWVDGFVTQPALSAWRRLAAAAAVVGIWGFVIVRGWEFVTASQTPKFLLLAAAARARLPSS
eukprot:SAG22_NODE_11372_length_488_cov_0.904884_1_plen_146_part_10